MLAKKALSGLVNFRSTERKYKQIVIYSEGNNYWPHLKEIVAEILSETDLYISFVSSSVIDDGLNLKHPNYKSFYVGFGNVCDMFFKEVEADILITSTPDLDHCKFVRSPNTSTYLYVPHSINSLQVAYNLHAFDEFDVLCSVGMHHEREVRALENLNNSRTKEIIKFGYPRLWEIQDNWSGLSNIASSGDRIILIAPTWGENGLIESGICEVLIKDLISSNNYVVLRPHPETIKRDNKKIEHLQKIFYSSKCFEIDDNMSSFTSMVESSILITDWSGISMEYAFGLNKPIIFADVNKKVKNVKFDKVPEVQVENIIREKIGVIWDPKISILDILDNMKNKSKINYNEIQNSYIYERTQVKNNLSKYLLKHIVQ